MADLRVRLERCDETNPEQVYVREPDSWQLGNVKKFPALERACGCAARICQHTHRATHSRRLLTAKFINMVAGRLPPSAERSVHPKVLVSQGIFAKCPSQTPSGVMWSGMYRIARKRPIPQQVVATGFKCIARVHSNSKMSLKRGRGMGCANAVIIARCEGRTQDLT